MPLFIARDQYDLSYQKGNFSDKEMDLNNMNNMNNNNNNNNKPKNNYLMQRNDPMMSSSR